MKKYIAVAGNIGSGKSQLIEFLCSNYRLLPLVNPADQNPYLDLFYNDMHLWSFHSQIYNLAKKFQDFQKFSKNEIPLIQNRTIHEEAEIFARNLYQSGFMNETDFRTYYDLYKSLSTVLPAPDLLIYLHASVPALRKRLIAATAPHEKLISNNYLKHINRLYVNWIADYYLGEVIIIDTEQLDITKNLVDRVDILAAIERFI